MLNYKTLRKLFKRRICKITTGVLTGVLLIVSTAFIWIFLDYKFYSDEIFRLEREDKIFEYRRDQEPTLYALCSYMGFTEPVMDSCNHHCDSKADMWRKRKLMDFEGNENLAFMKDCPPILDFQDCDGITTYCNVEKQIAKGCPGTFGQKTLNASSDKTLQHYIPMANPISLFAQGRRYVRAAELIVRCPTCQRNDVKYIRNTDRSKVFKTIDFVQEGFPAYRSCSPFERSHNTEGKGVLFDDDKIKSIEEYERKMECLYGLECRDI